MTDPNTDNADSNTPDLGTHADSNSDSDTPADSNADGGSYNVSELMEFVTDNVDDREAIIAPGRRLSYADLDARANRLANHLADAGIGAEDHIGLQLLNGTEYLEAMLAAFKLRAVPVNVNYRYVERELEYLFDNADLKALLFHRVFSPQVTAAADATPHLEHLMVVDDDSGETAPDRAIEYEEALAAASPTRPGGTRSSDDRYIAYTGGTTGMPKGVVWRQEDIFFAALGGGDPTRLEGPVSRPRDIIARLPEIGISMVVTPPLMHVSAHWAAFNALLGGGKVMLLRPGSFDPVEVWRLVSEEAAHIIVLVGDAMIRPLLEELQSNADRYDTSQLLSISSGGAILSPSTKRLARSLLPDVFIIDGYGSTETGVAGTQVDMPGSEPTDAPTFTVDESTTVLDDDGVPVEAGSGKMGRLARRGHLPVGYYKDEEKSAKTFVEIGGERWVLPGDQASIQADGTIVLHGRGSHTINTGGEKVFPEEVESALVADPAVKDVLVVGVPDEKWGQRVVAVVEPRVGSDLTLDELQEHARTELAGYKVPRDLVLVDQVQRLPNGKADYKWAKERALSELT